MDVLGEDWLDGEARWLRQRQFLCRVESGDKVEDGRAVFDGALPKLRCHVLFFKAKSLRAQIRSPLCIFAVVSKEASATTSPGAVWLRPVAAHGKPWPQNGSVHGESSATKA